MWEPSNEIEHRLREALRAEDQDGYFRILAQIELVLPLSYEDANGSGADTWATWTTDDRTHILAFTSEAALQVCLRDNAGASRRVCLLRARRIVARRGVVARRQPRPADRGLPPGLVRLPGRARHDDRSGRPGT